MKLPNDWKEQLNRAVKWGIERGGLSCCGTRGTMHLPGCPAGTEANTMTYESFFGVDLERSRNETSNT